MGIKNILVFYHLSFKDICIFRLTMEVQDESTEVEEEFV